MKGVGGGGGGGIGKGDRHRKWGKVEVRDEWEWGKGEVG